MTSVAAGEVTYAGTIAGATYVVVQVANSWRITYGNLTRTTLQAGDKVVSGMSVGTAAERFHFGLRDGDEYIDPTPYLGAWKFRVRLIPADGSSARPAPPPTLWCAGATSTPTHGVRNHPSDSVRWR